jgi:serine O-acetyltransferase
MWSSDAFLAQSLYRGKARFQALGVPVLPAVLHRLAMITAQVCIGDPVVMQPGVYVAHGQVVIDGFTEIHRNVVIFPWVTIGLRAGDFRGPSILRGAQIGTGAKIIVPITVGEGARVGANAVVVDDLPRGRPSWARRRDRAREPEASGPPCARTSGRPRRCRPRRAMQSRRRPDAR